MRTVALLLAAGRGTRLGSPKAFIELAGRTLLEHAVRAADSWEAVDAFVVVAPDGSPGRARSIAAASGKMLDVVVGGETRQDSVRRGLEATPEEYTALLCHDVARPFATAALAGRVRRRLDDADAVVPGVPVSDTVKRVRADVVWETLPRDELVLVQTPQGFRREALERAHREAEGASIDAADDAALVERLGLRVLVVPGEPTNIKITTREDLALARAVAVSMRDG